MGPAEFDYVTARLVKCLAAPIAAVNARNVVHHDIKPLNIMFADRDGPSDLLDLTKPLPMGPECARVARVARVCLVDFGLARKPGCTGNGTLGYKTIEFLATGRCSLQADW